MQAYLAPFSALVDNAFGLLKRSDRSTSAADWSAGGGTLSPANGATGRLSLPVLPAGWYLVRLHLADGRWLSARFGVQ